jgi:hypothetical protein
MKYGEFPFESTPIQLEFKLHEGGKVQKMTDVFMQWTLHKIEAVPRVAARSDPDSVNDTGAQLAARLSGIEF